MFTGSGIEWCLQTLLRTGNLTDLLVAAVREDIPAGVVSELVARQLGAEKTADGMLIPSEAVQQAIPRLTQIQRLGEVLSDVDILQLQERGVFGTTDGSCLRPMGAAIPVFAKHDIIVEPGQGEVEIPLRGFPIGPRWVTFVLPACSGLSREGVGLSPRDIGPLSVQGDTVAFFRDHVVPGDSPISRITLHVVGPDIPVLVSSEKPVFKVAPFLEGDEFAPSGIGLVDQLQTGFDRELISVISGLEFLKMAAKGTIHLLQLGARPKVNFTAQAQRNGGLLFTSLTPPDCAATSYLPISHLGDIRPDRITLGQAEVYHKLPGNVLAIFANTWDNLALGVNAFTGGAFASWPWSENRPALEFCGRVNEVYLGLGMRLSMAVHLVRTTRSCAFRRSQFHGQWFAKRSEHYSRIGAGKEVSLANG